METETKQRPISLAFVDDHPAVLHGMTSIFSDETDFEVIGVGATADEATALAMQYRPDVIFIDLSMPGDVVQAIREITTKAAPTKVVVLTAYSSVQSAIKVLDAGAMGFVLKGNSFDDLFEAVQSVLRGELYVTRKYFGEVMALLRDKSRGPVSEIRLNVREQQIIKHLLEAKTNKEIALALSVGEQTIKNYMSSLMIKLNARNRVEVVIAARKLKDFN
ncbi:response regulator transcription factor [Devosia rhizoryzae]|uniref:Response regulator transcription factor n=1 Tax=Devosia rhizoryzae TaxID=2774137 RepID=A0ABX7C599_9HYPH|nr:response regulator transcription factor [Devosia rhizoryzae]QQR39261.1 response regulator transcription factor [Devosia rhizoryzae]